MKTEPGLAQSQGLAALFSAHASADPDHPAVICGDDEVSRGQLERRANRLARAYRDLGVTPDSFVSIGLPNGIEFMVSAIATWKCGATPQLISSKLPGREAAAIIELAAPSLVVGIDPKDAAGYTVIPPGFEPSNQLPDSPFDLGTARSWKAPTSGGSTGRPKLIVSTDPATAASVLPLARLFGMKDRDTALVTGPLFHNAPFLSAVGALTVGGTAVIMPKFDATEVLRLIERRQITWIYAVPTMMNRIWRLPVDERESHDISSLNTVMHMAAPCPPWLKRAWIEWLGAKRILELYAGAEVQAIAVATGPEWLAHPGTVGRVVVGEMTVLDNEGRVAGPDQIGEIWMRRGNHKPSPYRYLGAVAQTREDGWETIGDMGSMDTEGYVYLADRKSDMIVVGGSNVYPAEIEAALLEHEHVMSAVVIAQPHDDLGHVPRALIQLSEPVDDNELRAHLTDRLARYKIPRTFERVSETLRDDAGKVRRSALSAARAPQQ